MTEPKKYIDLGTRGKLNKNNKLNDLTGKEWIKFSKSWFIHKPARRKNNEILHPAKYPESLVEEFIKFFSKKNGWILDPFLGTGSTLIAAGNLNRNGIGIELNKNYYEISKNRIENSGFSKKCISLKGNSLQLKELLNKNSTTTTPHPPP
ncbi:MAG: site-specific DNA-methyltransferase, partial [Ignavibacteriae bacterium]|nr:site-specific DNA-methyltransferase [Ignavibacteriota bacterium]